MENSRVGLADVTKPPQLEVSLELSMNLDVSKPALDITKPGLDISKPTLEETLLEQELGNMSLRDDLNPFDSQIHAALLSKISIPVEKRHGYICLHDLMLPSIR